MTSKPAKQPRPRTVPAPKRCSIEYCHIYTNKTISSEQRRSVALLHEQLATVPRTATALVVMVDDYSCPEPMFDYAGLRRWLADEQATPDIMIRESQLIEACDTVIGLMTDIKLQRQLCDYIRTKKYPCSLFIAAWYMLRLGYITHDIHDSRFIAQELLNILPREFMPFEDRGLAIIRATPHADALTKIRHLYF
ncbi:hypothetical protein JNJ66_05855 [Candidatus Saccharibacteria bacterium]|nr:hypothetical protein [Candidatus Saccharibacteria bacterium]